jgi:hypothetical protein
MVNSGEVIKTSLNQQRFVNGGFVIGTAKKMLALFGFLANVSSPSTAANWTELNSFNT